MSKLRIPEPELPSGEPQVRPLTEEEKRTDIAWWYPQLVAAGLPQPRTVIFPFDELKLYPIMDGETPEALAELGRRICTAAGLLGDFPIFLRTGVFSGKHDWSRTCFVPSPEVAGQHAGQIFYMGLILDFLGLPASTWAVRELLPNPALFEHPEFNGMPVGRERRYFVQDGEVLCHHPYWPLEAVGEKYQAEIEALSDEPEAEVVELSALAGQTGKAWVEAGRWTSSGPGRAGISSTWPPLDVLGTRIVLTLRRSKSS